MPQTRVTFLGIHGRTFLGIVFGLAFSAAVTYAVPPGSLYNPAETLDPTCAPGDSNCSVLVNGVGGVWGAVNGTLSSQTDLQNALNAKFDDPTGTTSQYIRGDGTLAIYSPGTVTNFAFTDSNGFTGSVSNATSTPTLSLALQNTVADGTTKGQVAFTANDFNTTSGVASIDYTNGQAATTSQKGFLTSTDWNTFNNKQATLVSATNIKTINGNTILGSGDLVIAAGGATNLAYTTSTRVLTSDTGTDVTLPLFTSTDPGLVPLSGGGTTNFLRADGTWATPAGGGSGTVTNFAFTDSNGFTGSVSNATSTPTLSLALQNTVADGTTKGQVAFTANDFNTTSGVASIDYTNGQAATTSQKGFLTSTDWNTFNNKQATLVSATNIKTINGNTILGSGDLVIAANCNNCTSALLQTDGVANGSQTVLNLAAGTGVTLTDNGTGTVTVDAGGATSQWTTTGSDIYYNTGNVGIGTLTPTSSLTIKPTTDPLGTELITNGTFTGNATGWELYAGSNGSATYSANKVTVLYTGVETWTAISTQIAVVAGTTYQLSFDLSAATDQVYYYFDNIATNFNEGPFGNGANSVTFTSDFTGTDRIYIESWNKDNNTGWTIDNVSVKEVLDTAPTLFATSYYDLSTISLGGILGNTFIGKNAGNGATNVSASNFLGTSAGSTATFASNSNFFGTSAGASASSASNSNFLGAAAGYNATNAQSSNFLGSSAGDSATNASYSNFFGSSAGENAIDASFSNFFGESAGLNASNATESNFLGSSAGLSATNASYSNFLGSFAGNTATFASNSNFFGSSAGDSATNAANSIFIGTASGLNDTVDNANVSDDYSILIGNNTSTGGFSNSIALGAYATNTATNQFMIGSSTRPINSTRINGSASTQCTITTGTGIACTSDERLKTNIVDLPSTTLESLLSVKTVTYNWSGNPDGTPMIGFLAQDLEQYFPQLVATDSDGYKSVYYAQMTPILVEAIREINTKIAAVPVFEDPTLATKVADFLRGIATGIASIGKIETSELCVDEVCVTKDQFKRMIENSGSLSPASSTPLTDTLPGETTPEEGTIPVEDTNPVSETPGVLPVTPPEVTVEEPASTPEAEATTL